MLDAIVVGAGLAGTVAAVRLAQAGRRVVVVARGAGSMQLSGGTVDVLGYTPARVDEPGAALAGLAAAEPEHPYARLGADRVAASLEWLRGAAAPLDYVGGLEENLLLASAAGAVRPTALAPRSLAAGDLRRRRPLLVAGFEVHKDFHPAYAAGNLRRAGVDARSALLAANPRPGEADVNGLVLAAALDDDPAFRRRVGEELAALASPGESIALPAVLGLRRASDVWRDLQERAGADVFEIPVLPPSVPGLRLQRLLGDALRAAGGRAIVGAEAVGAERANGELTAVVVQDAVRRRPYRARTFVLATGGFATGGLVLDERGDVREPVLRLPVAAVPEHGDLFGRRYLDSHPLSRAGIAVDERLRPVDGSGRVVLANVHVAGAMLAGAEPWKEKSGDGISLASGYAAAGAVLEAVA